MMAQPAARNVLGRIIARAEVLIALKARDPREPGRRRKSQFEVLLAALLRRYWLAQRKRVEQTLLAGAAMGLNIRAASPMAALFDDAYWARESAQIIAELTGLLTNAATDGVALFGQQTGIGLDYSLVNTVAAEWARGHAFDILKDIDATTRTALQQQISAFITTPGYTIGDVVKNLPYDPTRAERVAVTEITRAYSTAAQQAGEELAAEFPGVTVIKRWFTNRDGLVCLICRPLNNTVVDIDDEFESGGKQYAAPPAHVKCRCWMNTSTRLR